MPRPANHSPSLFRLLGVLCAEIFLSGCAHPTKFDPSDRTFLIEAKPVNLDPRFATDGQSQRLGGLIFSSLLTREAQMNLHGDLAESWNTPDSFTYLTLKTSTEEQAQLVGVALQEQWRKAGIDLELRPLEFATPLSDSVRGNFQLALLRWDGANNDPDVFEFVFSSKRIPSDGANRGHYKNLRIDEFTDQVRVKMGREKRKAECSEVPKNLAEDLPYLPMWFQCIAANLTSCRFLRPAITIFLLQ